MFGHVHTTQDKIYREKVAAEDKLFLDKVLAAIGKKTTFNEAELFSFYQYRNKEVAAKIYMECFLAGYEHTLAHCRWLGMTLKDEIFAILKNTDKTDLKIFNILESIFAKDRYGNRHLMGQVFWQQRGVTECDPSSGLLKEVIKEIAARRRELNPVAVEEFREMKKILDKQTNHASPLQPFDGVHEKQYGIEDKVKHNPYDFFDNPNVRWVMPASKPKASAPMQQQVVAASDALSNDHAKMDDTRRILTNSIGDNSSVYNHNNYLEDTPGSAFLDPLRVISRNQNGRTNGSKITTGNLSFLFRDDAVPDIVKHEMKTYNRQRNR